MKNKHKKTSSMVHKQDNKLQNAKSSNLQLPINKSLNSINNSAKGYLNKSSLSKRVKGNPKPKNNRYTVDLSDLNDKQKQAVSILDNPVIVIAGPGTGKTKLLTSKIIYILQNTDAKPSEILALTFTESAATNVKQRLAKIIGPAAYDVNVFTFHGFANYLINTYADEFFTKYANYRVISDLERVQIIKEILSDSKHNFQLLVDKLNPYFKIKAIISQLEAVKREGITLQKFEKIIDIETKVLDYIEKNSSRSKDGLTTRYKNQVRFINKLKDFRIIYEAYQKKLKDLQLMDYADLLNFVLHELETNEDFLRTLQEKYQYVLVDEYQDTNTAQNKLVFKIAEYWGNKANILVVGDDDQAIYRFQGASVANLREFLDVFNGAIPVVLDTNYRSLQSIISGALSVAKNIGMRLTNVLNLDKHFEAFNKDLPKKYAQKKLDKGIHQFEFPTELEELDFITNKVKELLKAGVPASEIAILVRQNAQLDKIMHVLANKGINFVKYGGISIFERPLINQFIEYLRLINTIDDPFNSETFLMRALHFKFVGIPAETVIRLKRAYNKYKQDLKQQKGITAVKPGYISFLDFIQSKEVADYLQEFNLTSQDLEKVKDFISKIMDLAANSSGVNLYKFIHHVFKESGLADYILDLPTKLDEISAFSVLLEHVKTLVLNDPDITLTEFLEILDLFKQYGLKLESFTYYVPDNAIRLLTVHKAKGLEFDYVFLPQATSNFWEDQRGKGPLLNLPDYVYSIKEWDSSTVKARADYINLSDKKKKELGTAQEQLQEDDERRAFYVALTRARYGVFITHAKRIIKDAQVREAVPSRFVLEIDDEFITRNLLNTEQPSDTLNIADEVLLALLEPKPNNFLGIHVSDLDLIANVVSKLKYSSSMLTTFLEDPREFYLRYILGMPSPINNALAYGNAFHSALEKTLKVYQRYNRMPNYEFALEVFENALLQQPITTKEHELLVNRARKELYLYFKDRLKNYTYMPIHLEAWVNVQYAGYTFQGKLDKVEVVSSKDALQDYVQIVDYKTSRPESVSQVLQAKGKNKLGGFISKKAFQLYFYKLLFDLSDVINQNGKYIAKWAVLDFTKPRQKTDNFLAKPLIIEYDPILYEQFKQFVIDTIKKIQSLEWIKEIR